MYDMWSRRINSPMHGVNFLSPLINTEGDRWTHTCKNCSVPPKEFIVTEFTDKEWFGEWVWPEPEYMEGHTISPKTGELKKVCISLPMRCKPCAAKYRRRLRMRKRVTKLTEVIDSLSEGFSKPKLLTFGLPTRTLGNIDSYATDREDMIKVLKSRYKKGLKHLQKKWNVIGGVSVIECTTRLAEQCNYPEGFMQLKHHAHVHMIAICPYIPKKKFKEFTQCLRQFGLGSIDVEIVQIKTFDGETNFKGIKKISNYITKYLTKEKQPCSVFGCMRKSNSS